MNIKEEYMTKFAKVFLDVNSRNHDLMVNECKLINP